MCISCRQNYDRKNLLKITNDYKHGIMFNRGTGRSAYICESKECCRNSKIKKKLQKALKITLNQDFFDIFEKEFDNYYELTQKGI